jgi:hypothetical protein
VTVVNPSPFPVRRVDHGQPTPELLFVVLLCAM